MRTVTKLMLRILIPAISLNFICEGSLSSNAVGSLSLGSSKQNYSSFEEVFQTGQSLTQFLLCNQLVNTVRDELGGDKSASRFWSLEGYNAFHGSSRSKSPARATYPFVIDGTHVAYATDWVVNARALELTMVLFIIIKLFFVFKLAL